MHEYIVHARRTRGTETSKYPEEKKTTEIPSVAASERGRAQTQYHFDDLGVVGLVGDIPRSQKFMYSLTVWKVWP